MLQKLCDAIGIPRGAIWLLVALALIWLGLVLLSGAGWNPFEINWNFSNPGAFGDAFGPFSTLMAGIAAIGAIAAYRSQARELSASKARQEEQDLISMSDRERSLRRELESDRRAEKASFEATFFNMLGSLRSLVSSIDFKLRDRVVAAHDAFAFVLRRFDDYLIDHDNDVGAAWRHLANDFKTDLNHYFRFLYHIILFVHESSEEDRYFYVRLIRATLSEPELTLLALNCEYGEGREKFKELVETYCMLHNVSAEAVETWKLRDLFAPSAFMRP